MNFYEFDAGSMKALGAYITCVVKKYSIRLLIHVLIGERKIFISHRMPKSLKLALDGVQEYRI